METPILEFVAAYAAREQTRLHMPGHKGRRVLGPEALDITEIGGADHLYPAEGIIRRSEENAARLFGSGRTLYSAEGSSLCIRAMLLLVSRLAARKGRRPRVIAARNVHKSFLSAAALLDIDVVWIMPEEEGLIRCPVRRETLARRIGESEADAVWLTSPDYLGCLADVGELAALCRDHGLPLLVDNAHGAYLRFLPEDRHPLTLGADLCCDSAHKTLPVLTGGAYLHVGRNAPPLFAEEAEEALASFASTSPSYLILQSLDAANAMLAGSLPGQLAETAARVGEMKERLRAKGIPLVGQEPLKLTLAPKRIGYTGVEVGELLAEQGMICEFADPDFVVMMLAPAIGEEAMARLERSLTALPVGQPIEERPPRIGAAERVMTMREALFAPSCTAAPEEAEGKVLVSAEVSCPPAVPIALPGERLTRAHLDAFAYYGISSCRIARE